MVAISTTRRLASRARARFWLDFDLIERRAQELALTSEAELCDLLGIDLSTLYRLKERQVNPSLGTVWQFKEQLGVSADRLVMRAPEEA